MRLTSHATWVRVAGPSFDYGDDDEDGGGEEGGDEPSGTFVTIDGYSSGSHGYYNGDEYVGEYSAGNPLSGHVNWEFEHENYPKPGMEYSFWLGKEGGSYHERWNKAYATVGKNPPGEALSGWHQGKKASDLNLIGTFVFSGIEDCCFTFAELVGCDSPDERDLEMAIPLEQEPELPPVSKPLPATPPKQKVNPVVKPDQANKSRPGETSEQYWKRIVDEQMGKYHYRHEGD